MLVESFKLYLIFSFHKGLQIFFNTPLKHFDRKTFGSYITLFLTLICLVGVLTSLANECLLSWVPNTFEIMVTMPTLVLEIKYI